MGIKNRHKENRLPALKISLKVRLAELGLFVKVGIEALTV